MIYLHIGVHKTGSSAIQRYLGQNRGFLRRQGIDFFKGMSRNPNNHTELHMACMNYERDSFGRYGNPDIVFDEAYTTDVRNHVQAFLKSSDKPNQIFTNEGLSWLRHEEEFARLKHLFSGYEDQLHLIVYRRDAEGFQRSYKNQIEHKLKRAFSQDASSVLYVEADSWVFQHDHALELFRQSFPETPMTCLDYDAEMVRRGNIIPSFLNAIGIKDDYPSPDDIFVNQSVTPG